MQLVELAAAEAGAQPPGILQLPIPEAAEQQGAEAGARAGGRRVAADHELGVLGAFHLEPELAAATAIGGIGALGNDALQSEGADLLEELGPLALDMIRIAHDAPGVVPRGFQQLRQRLLALEQRHRREVVAIQIDHVEQLIGQLCGLLAAQRLLQFAKAAGAACSERHQLAVEDGLLHRQRLQLSRLGSQPGRPVVAVACHQTRLAVLDVRHDAITVELDLVQPGPARRRAFAGGGKLRGQDGGQLCPAGAGEFSRRRWRGAMRRGSSVRMLPARGDLRHAAAACHAQVIGLKAVLRVVGAFDQQPLLGLSAHVPVAHAHQGPGPLELPAGEDEVHLVVVVAAIGLPQAHIPQHHRPAAVFALGDGALEIAVLERVVLHLDGEAFVAALQRRPFRQRPAAQHPVLLHAQIEMLAPGGMFMHDIEMTGLHRRSRARRFPAAAEIALVPVFIE